MSMLEEYNRSSAAAIGDDLIIAYNGNNVSTVAILQRLSITGNFRFGSFCPRDEHSCKKRCLDSAVSNPSERQKNLPCYCDSLCLDMGDCCYDFFSSCSQVQKSHHSQHTQWKCINMTSSGSHGYVMKTKCPQGTVEPEIQTLCETVDNSDFLRGMPVVDEQAGVVYRNVFCARCNSVQSVSYWRMTADCGRIPASALPQDNALLLAFIRENCTVNYKPTDAQQKYLKKCLAVENSCSSKQIVDKEPVLQELCSYYAFPICGAKTPKNPHCALCNGNDITQLNCGCLPSTQVTNTGSPTPPHTTNPGTKYPPHTTNPVTTHPPHTTNPKTTHPPHTTSPGTTHPLHTTNPGTTHPLHTTNSGTTHPPHPPKPGTTYPLHTTNSGTTHPPHTTNPVTTHPLHTTNPGTTHQLHTTNPGTTHQLHTTNPGSTHPPHTTDPGTTHQLHTTNPGTTHTLHTTNPGSTHPPHTTNPGTTHTLHTTNPGTTHPPHTTNPGTTNPPHTTNPGTTHPPHTTNPGTTQPPHTTNPGTTQPPHTTNPGTTHPLHTTNPGTTHQLHTTNPGTTHQLHTTNPGTTHPPHTTNPGTTQPPHTTNPGTTHLPHTTNPGTKHPLHTTNPGTTHQLHTTNPGTTQPPLTTITATTHPPHTTNHGSTHPPHTAAPGTPHYHPPTTPGTTHLTQFWTTPPAYYTTRPGPKTPGFGLTTIKSTTRWPPHSEQPPPPPLSILFDFSSNEISIQGKTTETKVVEQKTCQDGFVYDPFVKTCREAFRKVIVTTNSTIHSTNSTNDVVTMLNCSSIRLNVSDVVLYPNGTLWVPLYASQYNRTDFFMNGSYVFLCTNFAGFRNIQALCTVIAIFLHYFLLCSFAWMSIMAFDVAKTFVFNDDVRSQQQTRNRRKTLYKYCACAWGLPAIAVLTCFTLDYTDTVALGYGRGGFCWIKNGTALLAVVGVPVALVILFNFIALTWTVISIYKVRKVTNKLTDQGNQSSLALLYIKLTCVLGLTWVFGFLSSIVKTDATAYLFVVVNSLQGFFICLTFIAKKRTVALLRGPRKKHIEGGHSNNTLETKL
ncbi:hypothetical protein ACROYT_G022857 [Oculina patagonica]